MTKKMTYEELEKRVKQLEKDASKLKEAEEKKKRLEEHLQLAQRLEALGTLAGGIAHDFNNILMAIQGNVSLIMLNTTSDEKVNKRLQNIEHQVQRGAELTRKILGFARRSKYEVKPTNLNELIKNANQMFNRTKKEIFIHEKYSEDLWFTEVDQEQIEQVLIHLYVNAWQAMPGGGDLYIQTENVILDENYMKPFKVEPGRYVKISLTDNGVGMDQATQKRIFEPFFTTKEIGRGTGLGLASVYGIIKNHGGIINVYSEKGHGTTFNIYLPAVEGNETEKSAESQKGILKGTETILIIDDEDMILDVGEKMSKELGYETLTASSGKEALALYEKNRERIDLVILDMIMPGMSGSDTFDRMKELNPNLKVLISSGHSINGKVKEIMKRGCDGYIQKPFNLRQLSHKIREILEQSK